MASLFALFSNQAKVPKKLSNQIFEQVVDTLFNKVHIIFPDISKQEIINFCTDEIRSHINMPDINQINMQELFKILSKNIMAYIGTKTQKSDPAIQQVNTEITNTATLFDTVHKIEHHIENHDKKFTFHEKTEMARTCQDLFKLIKKDLNLLALGLSQVGKTALVKRLFKLSDQQLKLNGGISSDTVDIRTYSCLINGVTLNYTDCPGYFDSRGTEMAAENSRKIIDFIKNNSIDIILWVSKIGDIIDLNQKNLLKSLSDKFGNNIWKKTIIILTHANDLPPDEYYKNPQGEIDPTISHKTAWLNYISKKKLNWQNTIAQEIGYSGPLSIVPVENSLIKSEKINDIYTLLDGTPILESLMLEIFKLISTDAMPIMFLALAGEQNPVADQVASPMPAAPVVSPVPAAVPAVPAVPVASPMPIAVPAVPIPIASPTPVAVPIPNLTEQQQALDRATDKLLDNSPKKKSIWNWCVLL